MWGGGARGQRAGSRIPPPPRQRPRPPSMHATAVKMALRRSSPPWSTSPAPPPDAHRLLPSSPALRLLLSSRPTRAAQTSPSLASTSLPPFLSFLTFSSAGGQSASSMGPATCGRRSWPPLRLRWPRRVGAGAARIAGSWRRGGGRFLCLLCPCHTLKFPISGCE
jgi:hypothetical protein